MQQGLVDSATEPRSQRSVAIDQPSSSVTQAGDAELLERFVAVRDEDAFAELVARHGPMVLGVCRRLLRSREAAQDAFQVTFLVLARKAAEVGQPELVVNWLHGVACRTALRLKDRSSRQQRHERQGATMPEPEQPASCDNGEALAVLDEELNHLPEMYRTLLVLCYLEGNTHEEAARKLDCPLGSISWRMARAREALHRRLTRRGIVLPGTLLALLLSAQRTWAGTIPAELASQTTRAAVQYANGTPGAVPADHAALSKEVLDDIHNRSPWSDYKVLVVLLLLALFGGAAGATGTYYSGVKYRHGTNQPAASMPETPGEEPAPLVTGCGCHDQPSATP